MISVVLFALSVLLASVSGWAGCSSVSHTVTVYADGWKNRGCNCDYWGNCSPSTESIKSSLEASCEQVLSFGSGFFVYSHFSSTGACSSFSNDSQCGNVGADCYNITGFCNYNLYCSTQAEADSANCALNPSAPGCENSDPCAPYRAMCNAAKGKFDGEVTDGKCYAECNTCDNESVKVVKETYRQMCCKKMMAPPGDLVMCYVPSRSGPGMQSSVYEDNTREYKCQDPNLDSLTSERYYRMCYDYDPDEDESSSSGGDGSSSGGDGSSSSGDGGSSGSQYPEGCDECPWLDSILDTLTLQKGKVDAIYDCLTLPGLCSGMENERDTTVINIDSALLKYITPYLDSTIRLDSSQLRALQKLDTNLLKAMKNDSAALDNDTMIYRSITDAGYTNDTNLIELRVRVFRMDTAMRHRLDSLIKSLPKDVLDSIVKYQDSTMDRIDSALWGKGVGFSLVDSLVDSTVKYFKVSNHYDSVYNVMFHDFDSTFKYKMENLEVSVESDYAGLGYGDTATSNLRTDVLGVRDAIRDMDSSVSAGMSDIRGVLEGLELGGDWTGAFDSAIAANGGGAVDTSGVYLDIYGGELLADSIARDVGYDKIDVARDTAAMDSVLALDYTETDSTLCVGSECVSYDSDAKIADSAQRYIARQGDSIRASNQAFYNDSVDSYFQQVKDTLTKWNPFGMFDSTLMKTLGAKVPNSNTCPEHCSKYKVEVPFIFGNLGIDLDWQLCASWAVLGGQNVMSFLRFIIRVIVAVTCIAMIMRAAANTKVR